MMTTRRTAFLLLTGALLSTGADAAQKNATRRGSRAKTTPPRDYGEQPQDRDRRLARECRNLRNAGACAGFGYGS